VKKTASAKQLVEEAAKARSDLHIFHAVIALMESSLLSSESFADEERIVGLCKKASVRCLSRYDRALDRLQACVARRQGL
jgi:hypothetical protein